MLVTNFLNIAMAYAETSEYEKNIGCTATFNTMSGVESYFITETEPDDSWGQDSLVYFPYEIPSDLILEIDAYKILTEKFEGFKENGGTELIERQSLWYKVKLYSGTMPEGISDGYWVMQNFLNEEDAYEYDSLIIETTEKDNITVIDEEGNEVGEEIELPQYEKKKITGVSSLSGDVDYQWQILIDDTWIDIYGEDEAEFLLSYGVVATVLDDFQAQIRPTTKKMSKVFEGESITVTIIPYEEDELDNEEIREDETPNDPEVHSDDEEFTELTVENDDSNFGNNSNKNGAKELNEVKSTSDGEDKNEKKANESDTTITPSTDDADDSKSESNSDKTEIEETEEKTEINPKAEESTVSPEITPSKEEDETFLGTLLSMFTMTAYAENGVAPAEENDTTIYNVVINYIYENGKTAETSFTATVGETGHLNSTVVFPTILGYSPYVNDVPMDEYVFNLKGSEMTQDFVMNVVYKPTLVDYTVVVMQQNVHNDSYTEFERKTLQALTGTVITGDMQVDISYPGFYQLLHNQVTIAADGSTVIEVRFDRYYYLMTFELGEGGYGVLPVYARCGTEVEVDNPTRPGYIFTHWTNPKGEIVNSPLTMPANDMEITAHWTPSTAKYSVVYWKENADPNSDGTYGYTYWGSTIIDSVSGTVVSGSDDIPTSITNATVNGKTVDEKKYFTYNDSLTDKNVVVKGDGTTVVNVYYTRNYYTIYFKGYGVCCRDEHTHGNGCNSKLTCSLEEHAHESTCNRTLSCAIPSHSAHDADCLICGKVEHTEHTDDCLQCTHTHNQINCYTTQNLTRASTLNGNGKTAYERLVNLIGQNSPQNATVYRTYRSNSNNTSTIYNFFYFDGVWYYLGTGNSYSGIQRNGNTPSPNKNNYASVVAKVNCNHNHDENCYTDELHEHISACYKDVIHTHNESCYKYSCGKVTHTHGTGCYSTCTLMEHAHTTNCTTNSSDNVVYVITAKYEANVGNIWPTYDKLAASNSYHYKNSNGEPVNNTASRFRGWTIPGASNEAVSKRVNMTPDLCNTQNGYQNATANYGASYSYKLYYMFESFDQTDTQETDTRKKYGGVWYDSDPIYYQELMYSSATTFGQKEILGMNPVGVDDEVRNSVRYNWLYYTRNRSSLKYQNIDTVIETKTNIMFGESLKGYQYTANDGIPPHPSSLEAGAYEFAGWYTTAGCYDGTEVNFDTATMPNGDMVLYAKWEPVTHTVQFYTQKDNAGNLIEKIGDNYEVKHNQKLNEQYIPQAPEDFENGAYSFNGWWYMDGNTEQRFDFKSLPVTRDLVVYAKWTSNKLIPYEFHFRLADGTPVADSVYGSDLAGNTITLDAKGGASLYPEYREGYFPNTTSHSLTLNIDDNDKVLSYTFVYEPAEKVPYAVYYVAETLKDGGTSLGKIEIGNKSYFVLANTKTVDDNQLAYVSENFVSVPGYVPDEFQKNLVIVPGNENIIVFHYTVDEKNAPYKVTHYIQNLDGETWTVEYTYSGIAKIDSSYSESPMTNLVGFTYDKDRSIASGTVSKDGLELKLYYVRNQYPYKVVYKVQSTGDVIYTSDTKTELYGKVVSATAPSEYESYSLVSDATQTTTIRVETDLTNPTLNIITFYYKEKEVIINYKVVGPTGCGTVSPESESLRISSNEASGSIANPSSSVYKFVGWYSDELCTNLLSTDANFVPQKDGENWVASTYYAKFEYALASLTISKKGADEIDENQTFIFTVKGIAGTDTADIDLRVVVKGNGSVTINDLPIGTYEVTEETAWSWRYEPVGQKYTVDLKVQEENKAPFENNRKRKNWLNGAAYCKNLFTTKEEKTEEEGEND